MGYRVWTGVFYEQAGGHYVFQGVLRVLVIDCMEGTPFSYCTLFFEAYRHSLDDETCSDTGIYFINSRAVLDPDMLAAKYIDGLTLLFYINIKHITLQVSFPIHIG